MTTKTSANGRPDPVSRFFVFSPGLRRAGAAPRCPGPVRVAGALLVLASTVAAEPPTSGPGIESMVIQAVQAAKTIRHEVEFRSPLGSTRREVMLEGPAYHSFSLVTGHDQRREEARFNWYRIAGKKEQAPRRVAVVVKGEKPSRVEFGVGPARFFLATAQALTKGPPPAAPEELSHMVAYGINEEGDAGAAGKVEVSTGGGKITVRLGRPLFLCVPVEEWHHAEYFPVGDAGFRLVVYETMAFGKENAPEIATLDQFSLGALRLERAALVGVAARAAGDQ